MKAKLINLALVIFRTRIMWTVTVAVAVPYEIISQNCEMNSVNIQRQVL